MGRKLRGYYWTVRQAEFATDVMFRSREALDRIYPTLVRHALEHFRSPERCGLWAGGTPCSSFGGRLRRG